ncbi:hypothetical protein EVAR_9885_1 [Eumeta japonica]|uniref:Uncharacterized protein n=1 Tax=Eumeta variegata TaxID=151549 RepID=A0A4C1TQD7_EUMVA|nr:hypothetical protein EVAR_9885_1 [Eumeta japonica]
MFSHNLRSAHDSPTFYKGEPLKGYSLGKCVASTSINVHITEDTNAVFANRPYRQQPRGGGFQRALARFALKILTNFSTSLGMFVRIRTALTIVPCSSLDSVTSTRDTPGRRDAQFGKP